MIPIAEVGDHGITPSTNLGNPGSMEAQFSQSTESKWLWLSEEDPSIEVPRHPVFCRRINVRALHSAWQDLRAVAQDEAREFALQPYHPFADGPEVEPAPAVVNGARAPRRRPGTGYRSRKDRPAIAEWRSL
jgi:hypothetical protein